MTAAHRFGLVTVGYRLVTRRRACRGPSRTGDAPRGWERGSEWLL